jgi:hypothetical protein
MIQFGLSIPDVPIAETSDLQTKINIVEGYRKVYFVQSGCILVHGFADNKAGSRHGAYFRGK